MLQHLPRGWAACPTGELDRLSTLLNWRRLQRLVAAIVGSLVLSGAAVATAAGVTDGFSSNPFASAPSCSCHEPPACTTCTEPQ